MPCFLKSMTTPRLRIYVTCEVDGKCDANISASYIINNKTDHHDITEILLKLVLNTITLIPIPIIANADF